MSRKSKRIDRNIMPDPVYCSVAVSKLINVIMLDGKKCVAEKIAYEAIKKASSKIIEKFQTIDNGINEIILMIGPEIETKTRRIGGSNYQIPSQVKPYRRFSMGMKWLIEAVRAKSGVPTADALAQELMLAMEQKGEAYKKNINVQKMVAANRAYAHLA